MSSDREITRLRQAYKGYRQDPAVQMQWDGNNRGNRAIVRERQAAIEDILKASGMVPLTGRKILDVGCGTGSILANFQKLGAAPQDLYGVDLIPENIAEAKRRYPKIGFQCANAEKLDFPDGHFDLVVLFIVFTSILDDGVAKGMADEIQRVIKPGGGAILWHDFRYNNPFNTHVRGMTRQRIDKFFPDFKSDLRTITLLPPLSRRLGPLTDLLYPVLAAIPALRTHYFGLLEISKNTKGD
ncbi:MAG: class I SAM-dependent methyltransferase [Candidatus Omnitrophica bacterium]|nr:class I SAM-dependent methyltransferase [Candidatus Omnitrophota bacterium]